VIVIKDCTKDEDCVYIDGECKKGICSEAGICEIENRPETTLCDDGVFCNGEDACNNNGECITGNTYPCGDFFCSDSLKSCCEGGFVGDDCSQCVRFVSDSGVKTPDGLTWHTAYSTIQEAVDSANNAILIESNGIDECEIWIAQQLSRFIQIFRFSAVLQEMVIKEITILLLLFLMDRSIKWIT